jgi:lipoprotein NlpI
MARLFIQSAAKLLAFGFLLPASLLAAPSSAELLQQARIAFTQGKNEEALKLADQAVTTDAKNMEAYYVRARLSDATRQYEKAIADYDVVLKMDSTATGVFQRRGEAHFKIGNFSKAIEDFDQFIQGDSKRYAEHWQRGIACYYAGKFDEGRKMFEAHQTVNSNDVENAVWHFLCVARASGIDKAREVLIPISGDTRVPMAQVHLLFAGKAKPEDVLAAASISKITEHLFYAHLYLGLYYEAVGDREKTREHIKLAVEKYPSDHYMGDVARVHLKVLEKADKPAAKP